MHWLHGVCERVHESGQDMRTSAACVSCKRCAREGSGRALTNLAGKRSAPTPTVSLLSLHSCQLHRQAVAHSSTRTYHVPPLRPAHRLAPLARPRRVLLVFHLRCVALVSSPLSGQHRDLLRDLDDQYPLAPRRESPPLAQLQPTDPVLPSSSRSPRQSRAPSSPTPAHSTAAMAPIEVNGGAAPTSPRPTTRLSSSDPARQV